MKQQKIIELLDELQVNSLKDYKRLDFGIRTNLISRIYKDFIENRHTTDCLTKISRERGVKFHFDCPRNSVSYNKLKTFSKKISFFSQRTIVSVPLEGKRFNSKAIERIEFEIDPKTEMIYGDIITKRGKSVLNQRVKSQSGYFNVIKKADFDHLIETICMCREAISKGEILLVSDLQTKLKKSFSKHNLSDLVPANFESADLKNQFFEYNESEDQYYGDLHTFELLLPSFSDVPADFIDEIKEVEMNLYKEFHYRLKDRLNSVPKVEEDLHDYLEQIDLDVKLLSEKFENIRKSYLKQDLFALMSFSTLPITLLIPGISEMLSVVIPHTGFTLADYIKRHNSANDKKNLRYEPHYLLWKISKYKYNDEQSP